MLAAVIFDMDGVLIDSEPFWQEAQIDTFSALGYPYTLKDCHVSMGIRIDQIVAQWYRLHPWQGASQEEVVTQIIDRVCSLITSKGEAKEGVIDALKLVGSLSLKIGLATSSPLVMAQTVLTKLGISEHFSIIHSAQYERFGKPHPDVYIHTAQQLGVEPAECLAIEDSFNGLLAAKAALMKTLMIPDPTLINDPRLVIADRTLDSLAQLDANITAHWLTSDNV